MDTLPTSHLSGLRRSLALEHVHDCLPWYGCFLSDSRLGRQGILGRRVEDRTRKRHDGLKVMLQQRKELFITLDTHARVS